MARPSRRATGWARCSFATQQLARSSRSQPIQRRGSSRSSSPTTAASRVRRMIGGGSGTLTDQIDPLGSQVLMQTGLTSRRPGERPRTGTKRGRSSSTLNRAEIGGRSIGRRRQGFPHSGAVSARTANDISVPSAQPRKSRLCPPTTLHGESRSGTARRGSEDGRFRADSSISCRWRFLQLETWSWSDIGRSSLT